MDMPEQQLGTPDQPLYDIEVELVGHDGNAFNLVGRVTAALRDNPDLFENRREQTKAIEAFTARAFGQSSYDGLLKVLMETVHVV